MTENEAKEFIQGKLNCMNKCDVFDCKGTDECDGCNYCYSQGNFGEQKKALIIATKALEEIQQYRAIGTVEELQKAKEQYDDIHSIAEKTTLYGLCDYATAKEAVITEMKRNLDYSLKEYQKIGTIEEFKALKEKNEPKKPEVDEFDYGEGYVCGKCESFLHYVDDDDEHIRTNYCCQCGQKLDWE